MTKGTKMMVASISIKEELYIITENSEPGKVQFMGKKVGEKALKCAVISKVTYQILFFAHIVELLRSSTTTVLGEFVFLVLLLYQGSY